MPLPPPPPRWEKPPLLACASPWPAPLSLRNGLDLSNGMRLAPLTHVTDDSRTMLRDELAPRRRLTPRARTHDVSVISALPLTLYLIGVSSRTPGPRAGLGCSEAPYPLSRSTPRPLRVPCAACARLAADPASSRIAPTILGCPNMHPNPILPDLEPAQADAKTGWLRMSATLASQEFSFARAMRRARRSSRSLVCSACSSFARNSSRFRAM